MNKLNELNADIRRFSNLRSRCADLPQGNQRVEITRRFKDIHEYLLLIEHSIDHKDMESLIFTVRDQFIEVDKILLAFLEENGAATQESPVYFESN